MSQDHHIRGAEGSRTHYLPDKGQLDGVIGSSGFGFLGGTKNEVVDMRQGWALFMALSMAPRSSEGPRARGTWAQQELHESERRRRALACLGQPAGDPSTTRGGLPPPSAASARRSDPPPPALLIAPLTKPTTKAKDMVGGGGHMQGEKRLSSPTEGGSLVSSVALYLNFPRGTKWCSMRNRQQLWP
jgi:hypothetical protein